MNTNYVVEPIAESPVSDNRVKIFKKVEVKDDQTGETILKADGTPVTKSELVITTSEQELISKNSMITMQINRLQSDMAKNDEYLGLIRNQ